MFGNISSLTSSTQKVLENLQLFGKAALRPASSLHWTHLKEKYFDSRDLVNWVETGRHLPKPRQRHLSFRKGEKRPKRPPKLVISNSLAKKLLGLST
jgi:hypothetical protein